MTNTARNRTNMQNTDATASSVVAIPVSAPFALAGLLSADTFLLLMGGTK